MHSCNEIHTDMQRSRSWQELKLMIANHVETCVLQPFAAPPGLVPPQTRLLWCSSLAKFFTTRSLFLRNRRSIREDFPPEHTPELIEEFRWYLRRRSGPNSRTPVPKIEIRGGWQLESFPPTCGISIRSAMGPAPHALVVIQAAAYLVAVQGRRRTILSH